jgi:hypothetical protein
VPGPSSARSVDSAFTPASTPTSGTGGDEPFVRPCGSSVFGELRGWKGASILAGPLAFVGAKAYRDYPARSFEERGGRWSEQKVLVLVMGATPVTVEVAPEARAFAGLIYDPANFNTHKPRFALSAVRFEPCPEQRSTQFNGAFLVNGAHCVPVTVSVEGREPQQRVLTFGPCSG